MPNFLVCLNEASCLLILNYSVPQLLKSSLDEDFIRKTKTKPSYKSEDLLSILIV
jgi:hypothetical protein